MSVYLALMLAFLLFALLVMAIDVGKLYMVQSELQTAVDSAALAAATRLTGNSCATMYSDSQMAASLDSTGSTASGQPNDNRFNMRLNQIGVNSDISTTMMSDYFSMLSDAQVNSNGGQSGPAARYVRVQVSVDMPVMFTRFLSLDRPTTQTVSVAGIAGISSAVCTACVIDPLAVTALDTGDEIDYGFQPGQFYTLYLSTLQRPVRSGCTLRVPAALTDTIGVVEYTILNHYPTGPQTDDLAGQIFLMGAAPMAPKSPPDADPQIPGCVSIDAFEQTNPNLVTTASCQVASSMGRAFLCGLNTRFGIDGSSNACNSVSGATDLALLFKTDIDPGTEGVLQDYGTEYCGNQRRLLTVAVIDDPSLLTVLNFRQFLIENSDGLLGVDVTGTAGAPAYVAAFRAQYIGYAAPVAQGTVGGACVALHPLLLGPGRPVLHGIANNTQ